MVTQGVFENSTIRKPVYGFLSATMAISLAVYEIFSVKEWSDLENWVRGCSRSLKMAPFDKPYTIFYWPAIVKQPTES